MVLVTITDYVTVTPTTKPTPSSPATTSSVFKTLISTRTPTATSLTLQSSISISTVSALPTNNTTIGLDFITPINPPRKANNTIIILLLVFVIVLALLFLSLIGYIIFLSYKGQCRLCEDLQAQLGKWECGDLKRITRSMVRERERVNAEAEAKRDLERGIGVGEGSGRRPSGVHEETLARLEGQEEQEVQEVQEVQEGREGREGRNKDRFWKDLFMSVKAKGKRRAEAAEVEQVEPVAPSSASADRVFLVVDSVSPQARPSSYRASRPPSSLDLDDEGDIAHPAFRPSSSVYSRPTVVDAGPSSYPTAELPPIENVHRARRQFRQANQHADLYSGDLADHPREFVHRTRHREQEHEDGSAASLYRPPTWRLNKRFSDRWR